jgi:phosphomannomutase
MPLNKKITLNRLNPKAIRAYDIRGIFGKELSLDDAFTIGFALASYLKNHKNNIVVGYDGRLSSPELYRKLCQGLYAGGACIYSLGLITTPFLYFACNYGENKLSGIMITASHNPKHYNGFKIVIDGHSTTPEQLQDILSAIDYADEIITGKDINLTDYSAITSYYVNRLTSLIPTDLNSKVIWDAGNGSAAVILKLLLPKLPGHHILLNGEVDGNFPAHHPDPTIPANLQQLIKAMQTEKADIGVAFDGDADRLGVVTSDGNILFGEHLLAIFAEDCLTRHPQANIVADVKTSTVILEHLKNLGGNVELYKCGHAFIKKRMRETQALLAGEMSGHLFFAENYYGFDDAIFAACKLLQIIHSNPRIVGKVLSLTKNRYITHEIKLPCLNNCKFKAINFLKNKLTQRKISYLDIDGVRVEENKGWWLARASNTEDAIILRFDYDSLLTLTKRKKWIENFLNEFLSCNVV